MARAIVRCSLNSDTGSVVRNQAVQLLEDNGFERVGTFSFEAYDEDLDDERVQLHADLTMLARLGQALSRARGELFAARAA